MKTRWKMVLPCRLTFCRLRLVFHREVLARRMGYAICCFNLHIYSSASSQWTPKSRAVSDNSTSAHTDVCQGIRLACSGQQEDPGWVPVDAEAVSGAIEEKPSCLTQNQSVHLYIFNFMELGRGLRRKGQQAQCYKDLVLVRLKIFCLLKPKLVRLAWHCWELVLDRAIAEISLLPLLVVTGNVPVHCSCGEQFLLHIVKSSFHEWRRPTMGIGTDCPACLCHPPPASSNSLTSLHFSVPVFNYYDMCCFFSVS